jgi:hypothetical protein
MQTAGFQAAGNAAGSIVTKRAVAAERAPSRAMKRSWHAFSSRGALRPRPLQEFPPRRAQGRPGAGWHPRSRVQEMRKDTHTSIQVSAETSGLPRAMVLTAYAVLSPATNSSCHRRRWINGFAEPGRAQENLRRLDTSNGCQDHTVLPYATRLRQEASPGLVPVRRSFSEFGSSAGRLHEG